MIQWCILKYLVIYDHVTKVRLVDKNCPPLKFVGQHGHSCLGHKRPKMQKNWELRTWRVDTTLGQCAGLKKKEFTQPKRKANLITTHFMGIIVASLQCNLQCNAILSNHLHWYLSNMKAIALYDPRGKIVYLLFQIFLNISCLLFLSRYSAVSSSKVGLSSLRSESASSAILTSNSNVAPCPSLFNPWFKILDPWEASLPAHQFWLQFKCCTSSNSWAVFYNCNGRVHAERQLSWETSKF